MSLLCGLSKPHPSHNFMFARTRRTCPGIDAPVAPDSDGSDLLPLGACVTRAGSGKCLHPPAFHHCIICACDGYDATPPLVAASPVPPVVPDSDRQKGLDALAANALRPECCTIDHPHNRHGFCDGSPVSLLDATNNPMFRAASGSGVVPDKPALDHSGVAPDVMEYRGTRGKANASVPAVTDDEAATEVAARTLAHNDPALMAAARSNASRVVAALRSAGFLIVHHTKET